MSIINKRYVLKFEIVHQKTESPLLIPLIPTPLSKIQFHAMYIVSKEKPADIRKLLVKCIYYNIYIWHHIIFKHFILGLVILNRP